MIISRCMHMLLYYRDQLSSKLIASSVALQPQQTKGFSSGGAHIIAAIVRRTGIALICTFVPCDRLPNRPIDLHACPFSYRMLSSQKEHALAGRFTRFQYLCSAHVAVRPFLSFESSPSWVRVQSGLGQGRFCYLAFPPTLPKKWPPISLYCFNLQGKISSKPRYFATQVVLFL